MFFFRYLHDAQQLAGQIQDWESKKFDWRKAFVSCVFSAAAYEEMPQFELKKSRRAKVIPCDSYQANHARWLENGQVPRLRGLDTEQAFTLVARDRVVVVITKLHNVIFIALRGTTLSFADFKADADARTVKYPVGLGDSVRLHHGFFDAVLSCYDEVMETVLALSADDTPLYVTGHSLGGAMAAIFHAKLAEHRSLRKHDRSIHATACYTFGMPRFGDLSAKSLLPSPHHVFNECDAIPTLPPTFLGFADSGNERCVDARPRQITIVSKGNFGLRKSKGIATVLGLSDHRMEKYLERLDAMRSGSAP